MAESFEQQTECSRYSKKLANQGEFLRGEIIAIRPKESKMIVIMEDIYDQIMRHNVVKELYSIERLKTTLKTFTFNYFDKDDWRYFDNNKHLKYITVITKKNCYS